MDLEMKTAGDGVLPCDLERRKIPKSQRRKVEGAEGVDERTESWEGLDFVLRPSGKLVKRHFLSLGDETQTGGKGCC